MRDIWPTKSLFH